MRLVLGCLLLATSIMAQADDVVNVTVHVKDSGFVITLPANPTTGFQWSVIEYNKELLTLSSSTFEKPKSNLIGASGQMRYVFQLQKGQHYPETTELQFKYARSWEPKTATFKTIKVNFVE